MNILVADDFQLNRLALKLYIHKQWPDAVVYEACSMQEVIAVVFDVEYDLLILATNIPGNNQLEDFVKQAIKYTKIIVFSDYLEGNIKAANLMEIGADAFMLKSATEDQVISTLLFVCTEV